MDPQRFLPSGCSALQQTLDFILKILTGELAQVITPIFPPERRSNYQRYRQAEFNQLISYPQDHSPDSNCFRPLAAWMGRLILPKTNTRVHQGVIMELSHTPDAYRFLVGKTVKLQWQYYPQLQQRLQRVTQDVHFSAEATFSLQQGLIHPIRLNHWRQVDPLESLAGAHPVDDIEVALVGEVEVSYDQSAWTLSIQKEPIQISGRYRALVTFLRSEGIDSNHWHARHFDRQTGGFNGAESLVYVPQVVADLNGNCAASNRNLDRSPANQQGWYIDGLMNQAGVFTVTALGPRALIQLQPDRFIPSTSAGRKFIRQENWADLKAKKGKITSTLISPGHKSLQQALAEWRVGDQALLVHVYGGIGGERAEPATRGPIYFGHFAYGIATVIREPLADELQFDITYHQIYTHNQEGLVSGSFHWNRYMGDRQWGILGTRPVCDMLIKFPPYTDPFDFDGLKRSPLSGLIDQLEVMAARYRIGDGTGGTYVGPANNCAQDSNQALYASIKRMSELIAENADYLRDWQQRHLDQARRYQQLLRLGQTIQHRLLPFGSARADWAESRAILGTSLEDYPLKALGRGLVSWRTLLPRVASNTVTQAFLDHGASVWVLQTYQVGGEDPSIEPIAPFGL